MVRRRLNVVEKPQRLSWWKSGRVRLRQTMHAEIENAFARRSILEPERLVRSMNLWIIELVGTIQAYDQSKK